MRLKALLLAVLLSTSASAGVFTPLFRDLLIGPLIFNLGIQFGTEWSFATTQGCAFAYHYRKLLSHNPEPDLFEGFLRVIRNLIAPLLILFFVFAAYCLLFSVSPQQRTRAKQLLFKLIVIAIFLYSPIPILLLKTLLGLSSSLTTHILDKYAPEKNVVNLYCLTNIALWNIAAWLGTPDVELSTIPLVLMWVLTWLPHVILGLRSIVLVMLGILFPVAVLCYLFDIFGTRGAGRFLLEQLLVWTFLQVLMAVVVVVSAILYPIYVENVVRERTQFFGVPWYDVFKQFPINVVLLGCLVFPVVAGPMAGALVCITLGIVAWNTFWQAVLYTTLYGIASYAALTLLPIVVVITFRRFLP